MRLPSYVQAPVHAPISRRGALAAGLAVLLALGAAPAQAGEKGGGGAKPPKEGDDPDAARRILLPPLLLPGKDSLSFMRLVVRIEVRKSKDPLPDIAKVTNLKPRIVSAIMVDFTDNHVKHNNLTEEDIKAMKERIIDAANDALDEKMIVDVYIVSLITG